MSRKEAILYIISFIAIANFLLFMVHSFVIGGDAIQGEVIGGHYYVAPRMHGPMTEVSKTAYQLSYAHFFSFLITHALAFLAVFMLRLSGKKGRFFLRR